MKIDTKRIYAHFFTSRVNTLKTQRRRRHITFLKETLKIIMKPFQLNKIQRFRVQWKKCCVSSRFTNLIFLFAFNKIERWFICVKRALAEIKSDRNSTPLRSLSLLTVANEEFRLSWVCVSLVDTYSMMETSLSKSTFACASSSSTKSGLNELNEWMNEWMIAKWMGRKRGVQS